MIVQPCWINGAERLRLTRVQSQAVREATELTSLS